MRNAVLRPARDPRKGPEACHRRSKRPEKPNWNRNTIRPIRFHQILPRTSRFPSSIDAPAARRLLQATVGDYGKFLAKCQSSRSCAAAAPRTDGSVGSQRGVDGCPKSRQVMLLNSAPSYRRRMGYGQRMVDSLPKRSAKDCWNRSSFAQVTSRTLGVADHICRDLALTLANSDSPAAG
jgi:hypothetical protein